MAQPANHVTTHLVRLGAQGLLTLSLPEMTGCYVVIEQRDGQVIIKPMDLETAQSGSAIANHAGRTTFIAGGPAGHVALA